LKPTVTICRYGKKNSYKLKYRNNLPCVTLKAEFLDPKTISKERRETNNSL